MRLTALLVGLAVGQLVLGRLSDASCRPRLLLWGPAAFLLSSVA